MKASSYWFLTSFAYFAPRGKAVDDVKTLQGLLPICAGCKKIRDDKGYWNTIESYISEHTDAEFTHGLCPDCITRLYPGYANSKKQG